MRPDYLLISAQVKRFFTGFLGFAVYSA